MKTDIRDEGVLNSLHPVDLLTYLRFAGWQRNAEIGQKAEVWIRNCAGKPETDILVPIRREAADYALRASELLKILESVEKRSQQQILEDISTVSADVVRIRSVAQDAMSGSISIDSGIVLVEEAREILLASACATVFPKAYWARRKPAQAVEYLKKVRLGRTERGSYVITIHSPVSPTLRTNVDSAPPFERQVVETLTRSLSALSLAVRQAAATGDLEPFRSSIPEGVSANLCDAIIRLFDASPMSAIDVSVAWSKSRPSPRETHFHAVLPVDFRPVIAEASRLFKETVPDDDFELFGFVERLDRPTGAPAGQVFVNTFIEERARRVAVALVGSDYLTAVKAHADSLPISSTGDLVKERGSYHLRNARHFRIVEFDASPYQET